jgi:FeS assembly SUF system protein
MTERAFKVEEVSEAAAVPKAPPLRAAEGGFSGARGAEGGVSGDRAAERSPDFLEGFLNPAPAAVPADDLVGDVVAALRQIFDPEIPVNIYDLGLIYNVEVADGHCVVTMTLTTPHCPVAETMPGEVEMRVLSVPGIATADVNLVWDPAWDPGKMSDEAKLEMGML